MIHLILGGAKTGDIWDDLQGGNHTATSQHWYYNRTWRPIMTKRLIKHGNSVALVIDKPILSRLKPKESEGDLLASLERVNKAHGPTLEKLAH